jgi:MFS family permease
MVSIMSLPTTLPSTLPSDLPLRRDPTFRRLWASDAVSTLGTHVTYVALPLTGLLALHASATQVTLLTAATTAPYLLLGLPAGPLVEARERRGVLVAADVLRALTLLTVPAAWLLGVLTFGHLLVAAFLVGCATVFFDVAFFSTVPQVLPARRLGEGNARFEGTRAVGQTAGPGIGGVVVQVVGAPFALLVDAVSYLVSAAFLRRIPRQPAAPVAAGERLPLWRLVGEGARFVVREPVVRTLTAYSGLNNLFTLGFVPLVIVYAVSDLHLSAGVAGALIALSNLGYLAGSMLASRVSRRLGVGGAIVVGAALHAAKLLVPLAPTSYGAVGLVVGLTVAQVGNGLYNVEAVSLRQACTPAPMLARMTATSRFFIWGTMPVGATLAGLVAGAIGVRGALAVTAAGVSAMVVVLLASPVRRVRVRPGAAVDERAVRPEDEVVAAVA